MLRFLFHWLVVALTVAGTERLFPALDTVDRPEFALGVLFIGLVNACIRPVLRIADWPMTPVGLGIVTVTANGILFSLAGPVFGGWEVQSLWAGAAVVLITTAVTVVIGGYGEDPRAPTV